MPVRARGRCAGLEPVLIRATRSRSLQKIGYRRIALGGMVPQKTHEILSS